MDQASSFHMKKRLMRIILLGESGVGKTALVDSFVRGKQTVARRQYLPTIGADCSDKMIVTGDCQVYVQCWDTAGQERFSALITSFFRGADGVMLVYDVSDATSLRRLEDWKRMYLEALRSDDPSYLACIMVVGNKIDVSEGRTPTAVSAEEWCRANNHLHFEVSAVEGHNVELAFITLVNSWLEREVPLPANLGLNLHDTYEDQSQHKCNC